MKKYSEALLAGSKLNLNVRMKEVRSDISAGMYSAIPILSPSDFPQYDRSAVDGFAVRYEDVLSAGLNNPISLKLVGSIHVGDANNIRIGKNQCAEIFTGAEVPEGADAVVMQEDAEIEGEYVAIFRKVKKFQNIGRKGEDLKTGDKIIDRGQRIMPWHIPAFIETGIEKVNVFDLKIGVLSTGDEIVSGKVKNASAPMLQSLIVRDGFNSVFLGNVEDNVEKISNVIRSFEGDLLIVTGGSGPSSTDLMDSILQNLGQIIFHGIRMKPGRTTGLALVNDKPIFTISGLPVAALIAYENVIRPLIFNWLSIKETRPNIVKGELTRSIFNNEAMKMFVRVRLSNKDGKIYVDPLRTTGSGIINSVINADGYLIIDENVEGYQEGQLVEVKLIG
ncbi:molybdenum cofactor biosynthesis protein moeA [Thermoplasma volcanium GSS1]|uniref:Molybdenum cofactor biosynthesis protein moeA n=1 Tax=Thermoplasma volcanium (strain ATCC 51530 / DSM 4299 / JCM 9571 / NBRC 15438 / GSS1) TaxID=273116 RepID=Q97B92_THEVO|nr:molybdenum cofactor biosynthesis protein moeA [Thermoplasma volcanium GSS1]